MSARTVIVSFGGISKLARRLRHRHPSTVQGWWERGEIPQRRFPELLQAAAEDGILCDGRPIELGDLLPDLGHFSALQEA